jgi:hypothetical protein
MARYYTKDILSDIFLVFFDDVSVKSLGQDADAVPLPMPLRRPLLHLVSNRRLKALANCRGSFLFVTASKKRPPTSFEWRQ